MYTTATITATTTTVTTTKAPPATQPTFLVWYLKSHFVQSLGPWNANPNSTETQKPCKSKTKKLLLPLLTLLPPLHLYLFLRNLPRKILRQTRECTEAPDKCPWKKRNKWQLLRKAKLLHSVKPRHKEVQVVGVDNYNEISRNKLQEVEDNSRKAKAEEVQWLVDEVRMGPGAEEE